MVRGERTKEEIFTAFAVNGSTLGATFSANSLNGEITRIVFRNITSPGSFWVAESGTDIEIWRRNNVTSGLSAFEVYPKKQIVGPTNTTIGFGSGNIWQESIVNAPIYLAASGMTSGTSKTFGPISVYYR